MTNHKLKDEKLNEISEMTKAIANSRFDPILAIQSFTTLHNLMLSKIEKFITIVANELINQGFCEKAGTLPVELAASIVADNYHTYHVYVGDMPIDQIINTSRFSPASVYIGASKYLEECNLGYIRIMAIADNKESQISCATSLLIDSHSELHKLAKEMIASSDVQSYLE